MSGTRRLPTGPGAAAILAAGIGAGALGVFAFVSDASPSVRQALVIWMPSGPLSGVSTAAVVVWLMAWLGLSRLWATREVSLARVNITAFGLLAIGLLLTFPPFMDLLPGK
jgi:hypothetical protein